MTDAPAVPRRPIAHAVGLGGYNFLAMTRRGFFYTFLLVYLRERLQLPVTLVALIGAANATMSTIGQLFFWGRLSDRTDRRAGLMVRGELLAAAGYLGTFAVYRLSLGHVPTVATAGLVIACLGTTEFFWSMTDVGYRAAIAQVTTRADRGRFLGRIELIGLLGTAAGLFIAGKIYDGGAGFEDGRIWFLATGFILAGVPLVKVTLSHLDGVRGAGSAPPPSGPLAPDFSRYMWALGVAVIGLMSFLQIHSFFVRLPDVAAADDEALSRIRIVFWAAGGLFAPIAGRLIDGLSARRAYVGFLLASSLLVLAFPPTRSELWAAISLGIYGACFTAFRTASYAVAAELTPADSPGRHFAVYNVVMSLGWGFAAVAVAGPTADLAHALGASSRAAYSASFLAGGALGLIGLGLFFALRPKSSAARE